MSLQVQIRKSYKGFRLNIAFETEGAPLALLGASGSGKSMTLRCIAGIETPDEGRIVLNGRTLFDSAKKINVKPRQRRVGYLFQSYALFPGMTVGQNIACGAAGTRGEKQRQVAQLVARFELAGLENRYPAQLSGGQQQRVALARMLAASPEVLLLDEPFSALDAHLKERMQVDMLALLKGYGGDALLVTHSRDEAYKLCPSLLVLEGGQKLAQGNTHAMFKNPASLGVARLTGCKNLAPARAVGANAVEVPAWGIKLRVEAPLPKGLTHVGVRAHDFAPARNGDEVNAFAVQQVQSIEGPFEWNILLRPEGRQDAEIWWKVPKANAPLQTPQWLTVPPDAILLLTQ